MAERLNAPQTIQDSTLRGADEGHFNDAIQSRERLASRLRTKIEVARLTQEWEQKKGSAATSFELELIGDFVRTGVVPDLLKNTSDSGKYIETMKVPDVILRNVNLRDVVELAQRYDMHDQSQVDEFCKNARSLEQKKNRISSEPHPRLTPDEKELVEQIKSKNFPLWFERKTRKDDLRQLKAPFYFAKVYADFMGEKLTRKVLNAVDPGLVSGISNWQRNNNGQLPDGVVLPNAVTETRAWVERVKAGLPVEQATDPSTLVRNASRLKRAAERESQRG